VCGVKPSVETIFKFARLRSKDFSFQTKSAYSDSPYAGGVGEFCWTVTRQRMSQSETFDVREVKARLGFQHIGRSSDRAGETWKFVRTSDAKSEKKQNRCTSIVRALKSLHVFECR